ncbi:dTDP-4-dehydrorhamnose reductase [Pedobacter sp. PACM 27299]|uniref:dTDP-4-dehydrorhamnose reductase n=1 Tax=Pedobacter sp. PACM 27299 TaxID=1727164 RepID=UPI0007064CE2|nr:dTDP-4-dehydrorhamnose reductase [Pedobacter sp. PACM 27299]ALL04407.1 dTDP-4-dehydrorhamnose reductase [Pedobacter sp. PACM 27299]
MKNKILVFGGIGQLGTCIEKVSMERGLSSLLYLDEIHGNILDLDLLHQLFQKESPQFVINCAAYTAVDKAEDDFQLCKKINQDGAENLAGLCAEYNATLIHVSTDFVFEGNLPKLLNEQDIANPINVYGITKLDGELGIARLLEAHYIIRTSWLYSEFASNFVKTMRKLGTDRDELGVIVDQVGTPTYAIDLAGVILDIITIDNEKYGTYHYSNEGVTSWYDFAKGIFDISEIEVKLNPIPGSAYPTKAVRPAFSVMDKSKIKTTFGIVIPYWRDSLVKCINELNK